MAKSETDLKDGSQDEKFKDVLACLALLLGVIGGAAQTYGWDWATPAGGVGYDVGRAIASDSQGNLYSIGYFSGTATFGSTTLETTGDFDIYIAKLDSSGNFLWAVQAGGTDDDQGYGIAVDAAANVYVTGYYRGSAAFGSTTLTGNGMYDIFIAKLDTNGSFLWAVCAGGTNDDCGLGIAVDASANAYLTGFFQGTAIFGTTTLTTSGSYEAFAAKLDANGNFHWAVRAGGAFIDVGYGIAVDNSANVYLTGYFSNTATFGTLTLTSSGGSDIFAAKLDSNGNYLWAVRAGGTWDDLSRSIAVDSTANVYLTGYFSNSATFGTLTLTSIDASDDVFTAKLDNNGSFIWAVRAGGEWGDTGYGIAVDSAGNVCLAGDFQMLADFGATTLTSDGDNEIFVAELDSAGNYLWARQAFGSSVDHGYGIAVDDSGNIYLAGTFYTSAAFGTDPITSNGGADSYVAKLSSGVAADDDLMPDAASPSILSEVWPNPIRRGETATIKAFIDERETGTLTIFNLRGQVISTHELAPGEHQISLDSGGLSSGIYLYQLEAKTVSAVRKLVILK